MPGTKRESTPWNQQQWEHVASPQQSPHHQPTHNHPLPFGLPNQSAPIQPVDEHQQSWLSSDEGSFPEIPGYIIESKLAEGGMGAVYVVRQEGTNAVRAAKTIKSKEIDLEALERFRIEYEALGQINHPNVVRVHASGVHNKIPYLIMELVEGHELEDDLGDVWDATSAAAIAERILRALQAIHDVGIIHRDIKPQNIFLCADDQPKIVDFGLARMLQGEGLTRTGDILGTPTYMAPEQIIAVQEEVTHKVDVWAVGVILYQMLAGVIPFEQRNAIGIMSEIALGSYPRIESRVLDIDPDLGAIVSRAMARNPNLRYESAAEMADDLVRFLEGNTSRARKVRDHNKLYKWAVRLLVFFATLSVLLFGLIYQQHQKKRIKAALYQLGALKKTNLAQIDSWNKRWQDPTQFEEAAFRTEVKGFEKNIKSALLQFDSKYSNVSEAGTQRLTMNAFLKELRMFNTVLSGHALKPLESRRKTRFDLLFANLYFLQGQVHFNNGEQQSSAEKYKKAWQIYVRMLGKNSLLEKEQRWLLKRSLLSVIRAQQGPEPINPKNSIALFNPGEIGSKLQIQGFDKGLYKEKLGIFVQLIADQNLDDKSLKEQQQALAKLLYNMFNEAFRLETQPSNASAKSFALALEADFEETLDLLLRWKLPVLQRYKHLEARTTIYSTQISKRLTTLERQRKLLLEKKMDASNNVRARRNNLPYFWEKKLLNRFVEDVRILLDDFQKIQLLAHDNSSRKKLQELIRPFFENESYLLLRWDDRLLYLKALHTGFTSLKTIGKGFESLQWRIAEDHLLDARAGQASLEESRKRLEQTLTQMNAFLKKNNNKKELDEERLDIEELVDKYITRQQDPMTSKRRRFLAPRVFGYIIRCQLLRQKDEEAQETLNALNGQAGSHRGSKIPVQGMDAEILSTFKDSPRLRIFPHTEWIRIKLPTMSAPKIDETIKSLEKDVKDEEGKRFEHGRIMLISLYLAKARKLNSWADKKQAFLNEIDFEKLEKALGTYRLSSYSFEFLLEWIQGLRDLAELYQIANNSSAARRTLRFAEKLTDGRRHPILTEKNDRIRNRLKTLGRK
jgi:tRNA A-37 threonylcarbamoyl transferase component Bud32